MNKKEVLLYMLTLIVILPIILLIIMDNMMVLLSPEIKDIVKGIFVFIIFVSIVFGMGIGFEQSDK